MAMEISAPLAALVVAIEVAPGSTVHAGQTLIVLESMKIEHAVVASVAGVVERIAVAVGDVTETGQLLLALRPGSVAVVVAPIATVNANAVRPDLAEVIARHAATLDSGRTPAVERHHARGRRTARENIADLVDPDSFTEYGALALPAQRRRHSVEHLREIGPADGLIAGTATISGQRLLVMAYDYMVFAGTQGHANHKKTDRMLGLAAQWKLPLVWFVEGGGGRPGDTDAYGATGLDVPSFRALAALSGKVPRIAIAAGRCFAGNAVMFGLCDVTIATRDSTIGLGGPAMIEGGGLGHFTPEEVGPIDVMAANGVVDLIADDEAHAVAMTKQLLGILSGAATDWACPDQSALRVAIPENRLRAYDVRSVIDTLADSGSVLELRHSFGAGMVTAFVRIEGRAFALIANASAHLGGAIDADGASKAAHFLALADSFGLPVLSLCDTPGFMVGPEAEKAGGVRHGARLFTIGAALQVPVFTVVLRKGYGLGAMAMAAGGFAATNATIAWPTAEFGGMGLEGAVRLGYAKELAAEPEATRDALFDRLVARLYAEGKAVSVAAWLEIDAVIDPADTRGWLLRALDAAGPVTASGRMVDNW
jgi:acetyl-CoA carboxylase carboxyltransferase component